MLTHVSLSQWPVILYVSPADLTSEHMKEAITEMRMVRESKQAHAVVMDLTLAPPLNAEQRQLITERDPATEQLAREYCRGMALVFSSAALRVTLSAILLLRPSIVPYRVFKDRLDGLRWARSQLGLPPMAERKDRAKA